MPDHTATLPTQGWTWVACVLLIGGVNHSVDAQPICGEVFREYRWTNTTGDAGGALRVGGRVGYDGVPIELAQHLDLEHAVRAEIVIEKLSYGTTMKREKELLAVKKVIENKKGLDPSRLHRARQGRSDMAKEGAHGEKAGRTSVHRKKV